MKIYKSFFYYIINSMDYTCYYCKHTFPILKIKDQDNFVCDTCAINYIINDLIIENNILREKIKKLEDCIQQNNKK